MFALLERKSTGFLKLHSSSASFLAIFLKVDNSAEEFHSVFEAG